MNDYDYKMAALYLRNKESYIANPVDNPADSSQDIESQEIINEWNKI